MMWIISLRVARGSLGNTFLAIRQWEPEFKVSSATLSSVAVWIRLPELPIEFYEINVLLKIG